MVVLAPMAGGSDGHDERRLLSGSRSGNLRVVGRLLWGELLDAAFPGRRGYEALARNIQAIAESYRTLLNVVRNDDSATVMLLWSGGEGPGFSSRTVPMKLAGDQAHTIGLQWPWSIPEGAWLVTHGAVLCSASVDAHSVDLGAFARGKVLQLHKPLPPSSTLHLVLRRDRGNPP